MSNIDNRFRSSQPLNGYLKEYIETIHGAVKNNIRKIEEQNKELAKVKEDLGKARGAISLIEERISDYKDYKDQVNRNVTTLRLAHLIGGSIIFIIGFIIAKYDTIKKLLN